MTDIVLNPINSGYNLGKINGNFQKIENRINEHILHLTGGNNIMQQSIDMNSQRIINLPEPTTSGEPVRFADYINFEANLDAEVAAREAAVQNLQGQLDSNDGEIASLQGVTNNLSNLKINYTDVVDGLSSNEGDLPLSANQGRILNNSISSNSLQIQSETSTRQAKDVDLQHQLDLFNDSYLSQQIQFPLDLGLVSEPIGQGNNFDLGGLT